MEKSAGKWKKAPVNGKKRRLKCVSDILYCIGMYCVSDYCIVLVCIVCQIIVLYWYVLCVRYIVLYWYVLCVRYIVLVVNIKCHVMPHVRRHGVPRLRCSRQAIPAVELRPRPVKTARVVEWTEEGSKLKE